MKIQQLRLISIALLVCSGAMLLLGITVSLLQMAQPFTILSTFAPNLLVLSLFYGIGSIIVWYQYRYGRLLHVAYREFSNGAIVRRSLRLGFFYLLAGPAMLMLDPLTGKPPVVATLGFTLTTGGVALSTVGVAWLRPHLSRRFISSLLATSGVIGALSSVMLLALPQLENMALGALASGIGLLIAGVYILYRNRVRSRP
jgi:hypothetical protein